MKKVTFDHGFSLTEWQFYLAGEKLSTIAPDVAPRFTWEFFTDRTNWLLIPNPERPDMPYYKAELRIKEEEPYEQTIKLNIWEHPDLRRDGKPTPHNHPWVEFEGHILSGGYSENRHLVQNKRIFNATGVSHQAGGINTVLKAIFHEVTAVEPGTMSMMDCKIGVKDDWGYLDLETGAYVHHRDSEVHPSFAAMFLDRNPHCR